MLFAAQSSRKKSKLEWSMNLIILLYSTVLAITAAHENFAAKKAEFSKTVVYIGPFEYSGAVFSLCPQCAKPTQKMCTCTSSVRPCMPDKYLI